MLQLLCDNSWLRYNGQEGRLKYIILTWTRLTRARRAPRAARIFETSKWCHSALFTIIVTRRNLQCQEVIVRLLLKWRGVDCCWRRGSSGVRLAPKGFRDAAPSSSFSSLRVGFHSSCYLMRGRCCLGYYHGVPDVTWAIWGDLTKSSEFDVGVSNNATGC